MSRNSRRSNETRKAPGGEFGQMVPRPRFATSETTLVAFRFSSVDSRSIRASLAHDCGNRRKRQAFPCSLAQARSSRLGLAYFREECRRESREPARKCLTGSRFLSGGTPVSCRSNHSFALLGPSVRRETAGG